MPKFDPNAPISPVKFDPNAETTPVEDTQVAAPPLDLSNPHGEGLYDMQGPNGPVKVPFSQVQIAQQQGHTLQPGASARYRDDLAATRPSWLQRVTEPATFTPDPNTTPADSSWAANKDAAWNAGSNALGLAGNVAGNIAKRAVRTVAGAAKFPFQVGALVANSFSSDPDVSARTEDALLGMHPGAQAYDRGQEARQDWQKSPALAAENLTGDALGMWLTGKATDAVVSTPQVVGDLAQSAVRRLAGSGPGVAKNLVREAVDNNRDIVRENAAKQVDAQKDWEAKQEQAMADHKKTLNDLQQKFIDDVRKGEWDARVGTAEDQKAYWDKRRAAKQEYEKGVQGAVKAYKDKLDAAQKVRESNTASENTLDIRRQHEQAYQQATDAHYAKEAAADTKAKAEENQAWGAWRQKIAGKTLDGAEITGPLQKLRLDSPEVDRTLNQLEPRGDEVPQESPYAQIREQTAQQQYGADYRSLSPVKQDAVDDLLHSSGYSPDPIAFDPQAGQPISIDRVQRASSILQRYIRSGRFEGPLLGEMKQVAGVLRDAVTRASAKVGAGAELGSARNATITYQDAFGREIKPPTTARTIREQQVNPEAFKTREDETRLAKARRYDPTLVDSYRQVKAAREALDKLPPEDQLRKGLQQVPPVSASSIPVPMKPLPVEAKMPPPIRKAPRPLPPDFPPEPVVPFKEPKLTPQQTISADDIQRANMRAVHAHGTSMSGGIFRSAAFWTLFRTFSKLIRTGVAPLAPLAAIPAAGAVSMGIEALLDHPQVMDFLTRLTRQQLAAVPVDLKGEMPDIVRAAKQRGVKVSPILAAYAASIQTNRNQGQSPTPVDQPVSQGASQ